MFENDLHWDVDIKTIFPVLFWFFLIRSNLAKPVK